MKRTRRRNLAKLLVLGLAVFGVACGSTSEGVPEEVAAFDESVEAVSLKIEGMT